MRLPLLLILASSLHAQSWKPLVIGGIYAGAVGADLALTRQCINDHACREGNPMMPQSLSGQIGMNAGLFALQFLATRHLQKTHSKAWWVPLTLGAAGHGIGIGFTLKR